MGYLQLFEIITSSRHYWPGNPPFIRDLHLEVFLPASRVQRPTIVLLLSTEKLLLSLKLSICVSHAYRAITLGIRVPAGSVADREFRSRRR